MKKAYLLICSLLCLGIGIIKAQYTVLHNFNDTDGAYPRVDLTVVGNVLYGMAPLAGVYNVGSIFSMNTDGSNYTDLHDFNDTNGAEPTGSLTLSGNIFYGMASLGGIYNEGCIFSIHKDGSDYKDLLDFIGTNGNNPFGSLTLSGGILYGMTKYGGANAEGVVFSIDTDGSRYKLILSFNGTNGEWPWGSLTLSRGVLYGMTQLGGVNGNGVVFSIDTSGSGYKDILNFNGLNGAIPEGSLVLSGNVLYGMAQVGPHPTDSGTIFSVHTDGTGYKDMFNFTGPDGTTPFSSLTLSGGVLYGMTAGNGRNDHGVIFSIDTNGNRFNVIFRMNGTNGAYPYSDVTVSGSILYGVASSGGIYSYGVVFSDTLLDIITNITNNVNCNGANSGEASATASIGYKPYTYLWTPSGETTALATGLSAGSYTLAVTDSTGTTATTMVTITQPTAMSVSIDSANGNSEASAIVNGGTAPYTYSWSPGGATTDTIKGLHKGKYCCTVIDADSCTLTTCINIVTTGIQNIGNSSFISIYPDPNNGYFTVTGILSGQIIDIYNYLGDNLSSVTADGATMHFNISDKANGIYFISIRNSDGSIVIQKKIIKTQ